jgi:dUTP pyrophosphatase
MSAVLRVQRLDAGLPLPAFANPGDAGLDLYAAKDIMLAPMQRALVPTGIKVAIPAGHAGYVQPRSGLALRKGLSIVNTPGLIDSQYRGEVQVIAINLDESEPISIRRGERIAQLVVLEVPAVEVVECDALDETQRGEGGFGSSGV